MLHRIGMMVVMISMAFVGGSPLVPVTMAFVGIGLMMLGRMTA